MLIKPNQNYQKIFINLLKNPKTKIKNILNDLNIYIKCMKYIDFLIFRIFIKSNLYASLIVLSFPIRLDIYNKNILVY